MTRREFLQVTVAAGVTPALPGGRAAAAGPLPHRTLGRTGAEVSIVGLGGFHIGKQEDPQESVRLVRAAIDGGITFLDNCWDYNGGESELRMGKALRDGYRARVFLMSKIDGRDRATAAKQLDESLRRLQTDHLDLLQLHEVIYSEDPGRAFAEGGAMEALAAARQAGKARFLGFTGHKSPDLHLAMLRAADAHGFAFDTVQLPLNVLDAHHDSFERKVLPVAVAKGMGVLGMKPMADGLILESRAAGAEECLRYAMSVPGVSVTITGIDSRRVLEQDLRLARGFQPLGATERAALLARTAAAAQGGKWEKYKTAREFDGTFQNPEWLGPKA
ncbi:aldo/keto reductase [Anaeromyxobacter diazotrophicus]|uniref:Oxidoreductase n=1 Tax=Anaeromyxobacter diazotrophicus TaxID=2590199 RepID=A0A7I9VQ10_9BACT|nr:aldo/keto reductase [Anaeromyxobacter diazotrophicus]GEJ58210.1 oxidoreductase [Anaeromyxobacter diazotrophicus]